MGREKWGGGHCWQDGALKDYIGARYGYYATKRNYATLAHGSARIDAAPDVWGAGADGGSASQVAGVSQADGSKKNLKPAWPVKELALNGEEIGVRGSQ